MSGSLCRADGVLLRPTADGTLVIVGDDLPEVLDGLCERIVTVCARPTDREELAEVLGELGEFSDAQVVGAIDELLDRGVLRSS